MSALSQAPRSMRESCSWEGNTYAKYIFNPHRSWRDGSGNPTGTRIVDKAYAAKRLLDLWLPYPIEYKHGKSKTIDADRLQLCAEAMCLEEMLACDIPEGALFYQQTKRRERVKFDEDLRNMVEADFLQMHDLFSRGWTPKVKQTRSCSSCSLRDLCLPELRKVKSAKAYIEELLKESGE